MRSTSERRPGTDPGHPAELRHVLAAADVALPVAVLWRVDALTEVDLAVELRQLEEHDELRWIDGDLVELTAAGRARAERDLTRVELARLRGSVGRAVRTAGHVEPPVVASLLIDGCRVEPDPTVIPSLVDLAAESMRIGEIDHAIGVLEAVVVAIDRGEPVEPVVRIHAITRLGFLLRFSGRADEAVRLAVRAGAAARASGDPYVLAAAVLAWHPDSIVVSDHPAGATLLDDLLADRRIADPAVRARLLAARAEATVFTDLLVAQTSAERALHLARDADDPETFMVAAYAYRVSHWHPARQDEMLALADEMVRMAPHSVDFGEYGATTRIQVFMETGDWGHLDGELGAMGRRLAQAPKPFEQLWYDISVAARAQTRGAWDVADPLISSSLAAASGPDYEPAFQLLLTQQLVGAWQHGDDLAPLIAMDVLPAGPMRNGWDAALLAWTSSRRPAAEVVAELDRLLPDFDAIRPDLTFGPTSASLAIAAATAGSVRHADLLFEGLLPYVDQWAGTGGAVVMGPFALHLGRLAATLGRIDDAFDLFETAARSARAGGCVPWSARVELARAETHATGRADLDAAARHAREAMELASSTGMGEVEAAAERTFVLRTRPAGLSTREVDVLRLVATGLTNQAIADELFLSVKTIERHLLNSYRKIGARNRAEATAFVLRTDLG